MQPAGEPGPMSTEPTAASPSALSSAAPVRAGDRERDAVVQRLQEAFADGRLDDDEFDQRTRAALTARQTSELDVLTLDLPATGGAPRPVSPDTAGRRPGRLAVAYKSSIRRAGRWRVPEQFRTVVYKGSGHIDLRAAELTSHVTTLYAIAYKSRIDEIGRASCRESV